MQSIPKIVRDRLQATPLAANHPDADLLTAFAEQSLSGAERAIVLEHLARCGDCRDVVALALPPVEVLETMARPARSVWLTWPTLRWGFVAAGVAIVASIGILQLRRSESSRMVADSSPSAQATRNEARPQMTVAPPPTPSAEYDTDTASFGRTDEVRKAPSVAAEGKAATAPPPPAIPAPAFHAATRGSFGASVGGPQPPSQFLVNNNVQQQAASGPAASALNRPAADQLSSGKQSTGGNAGIAMGAAARAAAEGGRSEAQLRDQSADSQPFADKNSVSKTKLPVTQPAAGQIAGHVVDSSGAAISNARITLTPATAGKSASAVTDSQGEFLIAGLSPGNYKAEAQAPGFNKTVQDLNYDASRPSTYNFMLNVGSVSETVEVSAAQSTLLQTLPPTEGGPNSNDRNFTAGNSLAAGVMPRWTVSASGALQRSFDQGRTWHTVSVNAIPASSANVETARESRAKEKDADKKLGKQEVASPIFRAVTSAGSDVWAGGSAGALYHSLDAGNHWTRVVPAAAGAILSGDIISVEFSDSQNGKVTTSSPEVWTTSDAGQNWQRQ